MIVNFTADEIEQAWERLVMSSDMSKGKNRDFFIICKVINAIVKEEEKTNG